LRLGSKNKSYNTTSLPVFLLKIQFALFRFFSLILTESRLIFFPLGTETLQFPRFLSISALLRSLIRGSSVQCPHAARRSFSLLATPFISVLNQVLHLMALVVTI